jgi:hypothetical protein
VTLEDGTELIASADHRFLTARGWKHVIGAEQGPLQRPHLTVGAEMLGTGQFAVQPTPCADYRVGYLCGMVRGDGHVGTYLYPRAGRAGRVDRFRLALIDFEALRRAKLYLELAGVDCSERVFSKAVGAHSEVRSIATNARANVEFIQWLIEWPDEPSDDWCKGFLAGIFDAEGSCSEHILRIANSDPEILRWTERCMRRFDFDVAVEPRNRPDGFAPDRPRDHAQAIVCRAGHQERRPPAGRLDRAAPRGDAPVRHHDRNRRLHRQRRGQPQLLRPADTQVPGLQRRP